MPYPYDDSGLEPKPQREWIFMGILGLVLAALVGFVVLVIITIF